MDINYILALLAGAIVGFLCAWAFASRWVGLYKTLAKKSYLDEYQKAAGKYSRPYKLIIAGNYGQFRNWVQRYIIHAYGDQHLCGRNWDEVEIIKVGDWAVSPVIDLLKDYMSKAEWEQFLNDPVY